jgi:hypothetical protein
MIYDVYANRCGQMIEKVPPALKQTIVTNIGVPIFQNQ